MPNDKKTIIDQTGKVQDSRTTSNLTNRQEKGVGNFEGKIKQPMKDNLQHPNRNADE